MLETVITSSVLIAVLTLLRYILKGRINPRLQYALWLLVAVRLLIPFSILDSSLSILNVVDISGQAEQIKIPAALPLPGTALFGTALPEKAQTIDALAGGKTTGEANNPGTYSPSVQGGITGLTGARNENASFKDILFNIWLFGAIVVGLWFVLQNIRFNTRLRKTRKAAEMPISRLPVYLSRYVKSPCLFGLLRPAVYVHPGSLSDGQTAKYVIAHEETHYRHADHIWSFLRCVCLILHWFNPLVWWAAALSRRDCEIACDESTIKRIGDEHRKPYGNMLIDMIAYHARPSDLLSGATTMTSGKAGIKERIAMIAKKPKMLISTLLAVILVMAVVVGCTFTGAKTEKSTSSGGEPEATQNIPETTENVQEEGLSLYERSGMKIAIPKEYGDQLLIDPAERAGYDGKIAERTLLYVYQKSTYEKYPGRSWLFSITRYTEAQYEQFLSSDGSGQSFFARDDTYYYGFFFASDMQATDDYEAYHTLFSAVGDFVKSDFVKRNGLMLYSDDEFFGRTYTYDGEHVFIRYYPYYAENSSKDEVRTLFLSHPVKQGSGGIWCVERWRDQSGNIYPYFPDENGRPSGEYYASLQSEADAGRQPSLLDPEQVAKAFVEKVFGQSPGHDSFERAENSGIPAELYAGSTGDIGDYMPKLIAGEAVNAYDLLPCLGNFTPSSWSGLEKTYGGSWWDPLWKALKEYAVSDMQADRSDQVMRNYYMAKAYLSSDGAYTEMLSDLVLKQWRYDSQLYSAGMSERFTADEAARMRQSLIYLVSHTGGAFHLDIPGSDPELTLSLNAYPADFPFGTALVEKSRESFRTESFGQVTVIESDGLEIKYLHNTEGVYVVYSIRTVKEGYSNTAVAIGDPEEKLWDNWVPADLKKLDSISSDDEAWFGVDDDYAYVHTEEESTKNILYLIKDGRVTGIEIVNGLDGSLY